MQIKRVKSNEIKYATIKIEKYHNINLHILDTAATGGIENKHHNILFYFFNKFLSSSILLLSYLINNGSISFNNLTLSNL